MWQDIQYEIRHNSKCDECGKVNTDVYFVIDKEYCEECFEEIDFEELYGENYIDEEDLG